MCSCGTCREGLSCVQPSVPHSTRCITCDELTAITGFAKQVNQAVDTVKMKTVTQPVTMLTQGIEVPQRLLDRMQHFCAEIIKGNLQIIDLSDPETVSSPERTEAVHKRLILTILNVNCSLIEIKRLWSAVKEDVDDAILWLDDEDDRAAARAAWKKETDRIDVAIGEMDQVYQELSEMLNL